ncbi:Na+/H+ antiporter NhaA [Amnibacterium setariae]|uniref:Na(+)/H(+) antiporter NhaA n=1 Tax=Amnibacterium setariae TaxID=2306585 RepID=A0A3A1U368_9MICO|nr:Na+/H+ antiporter NhaA [Amnibacterium setariae]RIX30842.1 sodium:proton antiporter [Amnibacterium setariae]
MRFITSDRGSAALLLAAAALALVLAATPVGPALLAARDLHLPLDATGLHLTVDHLVSDGLLAVFFLLVAIELRHELTHGDLAHPAAAALPAAGALGGVVVPALGYLLVAGGTDPAGWPVPTATDIAFALGLLALLGRGLPSRVRAFLLALAILDDLVAILLIAVVFPVRLEPVFLLAALVPLALFAVLARRLRGGALRTALLVVLGVAAWYLTARSGVHATLAGVALGLLLPGPLGAAVDRALQPVSRAAILPLFAFTASLIRIEDVDGAALGPVLVGVAVALPLGKLIGIVAGGLVGRAVLGRRAPDPIRPVELVVVGLVGGVGFTVSLLMGRLAFATEDLRTAATLGVLLGSAAAIVLSALVVPLIARRSRARPSRRRSRALP